MIEEEESGSSKGVCGRIYKVEFTQYQEAV